MGSEELNHFRRLQPELIISVFGKISDAKWLCMCCLVSKHFAALVLQTRSVCVPIPSTILPKSDGVPVWPPGIIDFLKKLHCLESVAIRFLFPDFTGWMAHDESKYLIRWKCDSSNFILVSANYQEEDSKRLLQDFFFTVAAHLHHQLLGFRYIKALLVAFPNIKYVSAVDYSMKRGRILLEEEDIASIMITKPMKRSLHSKWWRRSQVRLPLSDIVMKDVILLWMTKTDDFKNINNLFEEKQLCQVTSMLIQEEATNSVPSIPCGWEADHFENILQTTFFNFMSKVGVWKSANSYFYGT